MNDLAIRAYHAATALGRGIPRAESSTTPISDAYIMDDKSRGAFLIVTADTMPVLGCTSHLDYLNAAMFCPTKYYYTTSNVGVGVVGVGGIGADLLAYNIATGNVAHIQPTAPSAVTTQVQQSLLITAIRNVFANAKISVSNHGDDEEGWTRPLIEVDTGITDPDMLSALEYRFYQHVENHETLKAALDTTTVLFE